LEYPKEGVGHREDSDVDDVVVMVSQSKEEAEAASEKSKSKRPRGRPRKTMVDDGAATVTRVAQGTSNGAGPASRKRAKPLRRTVDIAPRTVRDDFTPEAISARVGKRMGSKGKLLKSPYQPM
jgi:hypothetical protein